MLALLASYDETKNLPTIVKTMASSGAAAVWRINLIPVDTLKTTMQVNGAEGVSKLRSKLRTVVSCALELWVPLLLRTLTAFLGLRRLISSMSVYQNMMTLSRSLGNALAGFCSSRFEYLLQLNSRAQDY